MKLLSVFMLVIALSVIIVAGAQGGSSSGTSVPYAGAPGEGVDATCTIYAGSVIFNGTRLEGVMRNWCNAVAIKLTTVACLWRDPPFQASDIAVSCNTNTCYSCTHVETYFYRICKYVPYLNGYYLKGYGQVTFWYGTSNSPVVASPKTTVYCAPG